MLLLFFCLPLLTSAWHLYKDCENVWPQSATLCPKRCFLIQTLNQPIIPPNMVVSSICFQFSNSISREASGRHLHVVPVGFPCSFKLFSRLFHQKQPFLANGKRTMATRIDGTCRLKKKPFCASKLQTNNDFFA